MDRACWIRLVAAATALGYPNSAWGAGSVGPLITVAGTIALATLCLVGGFVWALVGLVLGWQWGTDDTKAHKGRCEEHARQKMNEADDPWGPRPR